MSAPSRLRPHTSYLICATPRSGSTLLCEALRNSGLAGCPREYFSGDRVRRFSGWEDAALDDYVEEVIARTTSANGVFGVKVFWPHLGDFLQKAYQLPQFKTQRPAIPELLSTLLPNPRYVFLTRHDKVCQAASLYRALQTDRWKWTRDEPAPRPQQPVFNFSHMHALYIRMVASEVAWQKYFRRYRIRPFQVVYEEFIDAYEETIQALLDYLEIPVPPQFQLDEPRHKKMADELNETWYQEYHAIKKRKRSVSGASEQLGSPALGRDKT